MRGETSTGPRYDDPENPPAGSRGDFVIQYNAVIQELYDDPANNISVTPPDFWAKFNEDVPGGKRYDFEYFDNIHPNGTGYANHGKRMVSNVDPVKGKRMKKIVIGFSILIICFYCGLSFARGPERSQKSIEEIVNNVVRPFFVALKNGDIVTLKRLMTKDLYEDRKVLFEQNKEYPKFFKKTLS